MGFTFYPPAAQKKLGSPWVGPQQVVRQATGHTVGIQRGSDTPIIFIHADDLKICPAPANVGWTSGVRVQWHFVRALLSETMHLIRPHVLPFDAIWMTPLTSRTISYRHSL